MKKNIRSVVHVTVGTGKMMHIPSVNTSSLDNPYCIGRSNVESTVCGRCYSNRLSRIRPSLEKRLLENSRLLSTEKLQDWEVPMFNNVYVRFHSYGEIINTLHYENLLMIAKMNPNVRFGLWTKRSDIVMKYPKAKNIVYVYSHTKLFDKDEEPSIPETILDWFDQFYFVIKESDSRVNCEGRCIDCLACYQKHVSSFIFAKAK